MGAGGYKDCADNGRMGKRQPPSFARPEEWDQ